MRKILTLTFLFFTILCNAGYAAICDRLYMIGTACEAGWKPEKAIEMTKVQDGVFTWTGILSDYSLESRRFKFITSQKNEPSITCRINQKGNVILESGETYRLYTRTDDKDGYDNAFQVPQTGVYKLTVDLKQMRISCNFQKGIDKQNWEYVKPDLGAANGGNVFPGVCAPFGMVKLGADCGDLNENSGWNPGGNIHGFSHVHVSGTGGGPKYGNILLQPAVGALDLQNYSSPREKESFAVGLYEVFLKRYGVNVRLTASDKTGFHEYTFPKSADSKILIDAGSCLKVNISESQQLVASSVRVVSDSEVEGSSTVKGGWNFGAPYTVYFYAKFDTPATSYATWKGNTAYPDKKSVKGGSDEKTGAYFCFNTQEGQKVKVKVGISFISTKRAKQNLKESASWNFDEVRNNCIDEWSQVLNTVQVEGSDKDKTIFYSAIHHAFLAPTDRTGENPLWKSSEPYYDDYYTLWDTFRATHPLFTLLKPSKQTEMVRSLIDIYRHEGYMPDGRSGNYNGQVQGGSNCDVLIADAMVKKLPGIDYRKALEAMIKNAETEPENARKEGRGGSREYNEKGYVSTANERSGTRTFEYAYCDYAIATVAKALGKDDLCDKYLKRSDNWKNLWNDNIESLGFKGFLWAKNPDGTWVGAKDYNVFKREDWSGVVYESYPWEMSFYVPQNMKGLIEKCGGAETFQERLDTYFSYDKQFDQSYNMGLFCVANEPGFLVPVLYNYINRPDKTAETVRKVLKERYNTTQGGLPGNDDSGSMSAWFAFHAMGFYPVAGQDIYLISSPVFTETTLKLENGKQFKISAKNANGENIYIQSATLNGKPLNRCWLRHDEIVEGGTLDITMGDNPSSWAFNGECVPSYLRE